MISAQQQRRRRTLLIVLLSVLWLQNQTVHSFIPSGRSSHDAFMIGKDTVRQHATSAHSRSPSLANQPRTSMSSSSLASSSIEEIETAASFLTDPIDTRPHEQRADGPRLARRLNHAFRYLHRHNTTSLIQANLTSRQYLEQYYTTDQINDMNRSFPPLLELDPVRHLHPKMMFLQQTMKVDDVSSIPPQYFGARLEKTIAPRHAFLVYKGLPHGKALFESTPTAATATAATTTAAVTKRANRRQQMRGQSNRWIEFLTSCRKTKRFCTLCNQWRHPDDPVITAKEIEAFDRLFGRGLLAAARDELVQQNNTWPLQYINITSSELITLMIQHGANPLELDNRGVSTLHWAAGAGNVEGAHALLPHFPDAIRTKAKRDGATPLHWAAAGANSREFGIGGHPEVCSYFLHNVTSISTKELVNQLTYDGNSALMWAAWSGTLGTVKMMVRHRADATIANRNGCTVAHWASSGGNLAVCEYLHDVIGVDFFEPNHGGNTPLTHAVAFGRAEIVEWLRNLRDSDDDDIAEQLAQDFVGWTGNDRRRMQVLQLFNDDYWVEGEDDGEDEDAAADRSGSVAGDATNIY